MISYEFYDFSIKISPSASITVIRYSDNRKHYAVGREMFFPSPLMKVVVAELALQINHRITNYVSSKRDHDKNNHFSFGIRCILTCFKL
jgi:hypothetical protein